MRIWNVLLFIFLIVGCATVTPYQPDTNGEGYKDLKIEDNKYRIIFKGNSITPRDTVETYLLYRAAELTVENKYDYFIVREQQVDVKSEYFSTGGPMYGAGFGRRRYPYYAFGYSWAGAGNVQTQDRYQAFAYITMLKGKTPDDNANAYNAAEVMKNLGPNIVRPPKKDGAVKKDPASQSSGSLL